MRLKSWIAAVALVLISALPVSAGSMMLLGAGAVTSGSCTPAYANGSGDRRGSITIFNTFTGTALLGGGAYPALVDGSFANVNGPLGSIFFSGGRTASENQRLIFDFGAGNTKLITEAKWYQDSATAQGTWQWYGSTDAVTLTLAIGSTFTLGGVAGAQIQTQLNGNATAYRSYILVMTAGATSSSPFIEEVEFKQCP